MTHSEDRENPGSERKPDPQPDDLTDSMDSSSSSRSLPAGHPRQIGQYQIRRIIASGGMGTVYEGFQENPRRPVAVKVIKKEVASEEALRRFEYEAQLLARLRHPGIAQIYEAGTHDEGGAQTPFFAMEYIPNAKTITEYARSKNLGVNERLQLFIQVCDAVHHGHQRGIAHRDLKPSNILVDSHGLVRVIDFGVARATDADLRHTSIQTQVGQMVGTAQYMSPEQFDADPHDIDTRCDIYTLGVVLFELLSGKLPHDVSGKSLLDTAKSVREDKPGSLVANNPELSGEIEIIVQKALRKDRDQRYQSAHGLALDIRRFITGDAISARPLSFRYQFRVFARRNKSVVGLVTAAFVILLVGVIATTTLYFEVRAEREKAESERLKATAASEFLTNALHAAVPFGYGDVVTVASICDVASKDIDDAFPDDPEVEAEIRRSLGLAYFSLDRREQAEEQLTEALELRRNSLGLTNEKTFESLYDLHDFYSVFGMSRKLLEVSNLIVDALEQIHGDTSDLTLGWKIRLTLALEMNYEITKAENLAQEVWEISKRVNGESDDLTMSAHQRYTWLLMESGRIEEAWKEAQAGYVLAEQTFGLNHAKTRSPRSMLAATLLSLGRINEAKELYGNRRIPKSLGIEKKYQGEATLNHEKVQILVFWETWCPYSQRAVPKIDQAYRQYKDLGVDVIGLTRVNRSSTDEKVMQFIEDKEISFPIVRENGRAWTYFNCAGTPFVTLISDGEVVWENYIESSESFSYKMLEGLVGAK